MEHMWSFLLFPVLNDVLMLDVRTGEASNDDDDALESWADSENALNMQSEH